MCKSQRINIVVPQGKIHIREHILICHNVVIIKHILEISFASASEPIKWISAEVQYVFLNQSVIYFLPLTFVSRGIIA